MPLLFTGLALSAVVTPVGPFCPFRSAACSAGGTMDRHIGAMNAAVGPQFASEMAKMQLELQFGRQPDPAKVNQLADQLTAAHSEWETLLTRWRLSNDFQTREYLMLTRCHADRQGVPLEQMGLLVKWQADCMRALAANAIPPMPPPGVDMAKMASLQSPSGGGGLAAMSPAPVDCEPFEAGRGEELFGSPVVAEEYASLSRDHAALIKLGESYGAFDAAGKLAFLDALEAIESRWDVFFARASLLGSVNPAFVEQTGRFLEGLGLTDEDGYRQLLDEAHQRMRDEAERERLS